MRCEKLEDVLEGKLRVCEVLRSEQQECDLKICETDMFQASLPGLFFENLESARHELGRSSSVPGVLNKETYKKEKKDA